LTLSLRQTEFACNLFVLNRIERLLAKKALDNVSG